MADVDIAHLETGLEFIEASPRDLGTVELIVRRPREDAREVLMSAEIQPGSGLIGDDWVLEGDRAPHAEITVMNARSIALLAGDVDRWPLAGDQLYVDFDLSEEHLPAGSRIRVGSVLLEVSAKPHTGCKKFSARFGIDGLAFVSTERGRALRLRGMNTKVLEGGTVTTGDAVVADPR
jgi:hypothetical protein